MPTPSAAYVFGPWVTPTATALAYREAPRLDDRAEVWIYHPDNGQPPRWAGCFGTMDDSIEFGPEVQTIDDARRALDQRIREAGHLLAEEVWPLVRVDGGAEPVIAPACEKNEDAR